MISFTSYIDNENEAKLSTLKLRIKSLKFKRKALKTFLTQFFSSDKSFFKASKIRQYNPRLW